jgi:hypothetical protein
VAVGGTVVDTRMNTAALKKLLKSGCPVVVTFARAQAAVEDAQDREDFMSSADTEL